MFNKLPVYQNSGTFKYKIDLQNIYDLSDYLGNPHLELKTIHVGGTNGKGSTSHILSSILQESGYKVGLYTSPHLKDFRERIKINGECISKDNVVNFIDTHKDYLNGNKLSFFESLFPPCILCKRKKAFKIIEIVKNKTDDILDIIRYMKEIIDLKRMKSIIFSKNQVKLLEYPYRLQIFDDPNDKNNSSFYSFDNDDLNRNRNLFQFKKLDKIYIDENEGKEIFNAVKDIQNKSDKSKFSQKIIQSSSIEIQNYFDFIQNYNY